jgi:hypothetical protein
MFGSSPVNVGKGKLVSNEGMEICMSAIKRRLEEEKVSSLMDVQLLPK